MKLVVAALVVLVLVVGRRMWVAACAAGPGGSVSPPRVPPEVLPAGASTGAWLVFSRRGEADVVAALEVDRPVVRVDPSREPHLAEGLRVRSTPTALRCDARGRVELRLDGAAAIRRYVDDRPLTA